MKLEEFIKTTSSVSQVSISPNFDYLWHWQVQYVEEGMVFQDGGNSSLILQYLIFCSDTELDRGYSSSGGYVPGNVDTNSGVDASNSGGDAETSGGNTKGSGSSSDNGTGSGAYTSENTTLLGIAYVDTGTSGIDANVISSGVYTDSPGSSSGTTENTTLLGTTYEDMGTSGVYASIFGSGTGSAAYTDSPGSSSETSENTTLLGTVYEDTGTSGVDTSVISSDTGSSGSGSYTTSSAMPLTNDGEALPAPVNKKGDYPAVPENMTSKELNSSENYRRNIPASNSIIQRE